jgi:hypothetical protein
MKWETRILRHKGRKREKKERIKTEGTRKERNGARNETKYNFLQQYQDKSTIQINALKEQ